MPAVIIFFFFFPHLDRHRDGRGHMKQCLVSGRDGWKQRMVNF